MALWFVSFWLNLVLLFYRGLIVEASYATDLAPLEPTLNISLLLSSGSCSNASLDLFVSDLVPLTSLGVLEGILSGTVRNQACSDSSCSRALFSALNLGISFDSEVPSNILEQISDEFCASTCLQEFASSVAIEGNISAFESNLDLFCDNYDCAEREELQAIWQPTAKIMELNQPATQLQEGVSKWNLFLCPAPICEDRQTGDECVSQNTANSTQCTYCAQSYSCRTNGYFDGCPSECSICDTFSACQGLEDVFVEAIPPPREWDYNCSNGGTKFYSSEISDPEGYPNQRFGGTDCICPSEWTGHDCSVCRNDNTCVASQALDSSIGSLCNFGWIPTDSIPLRNLQCFCDSTTCENLLESGADEATVTLSFEQSQKEGEFDVGFVMHKRVPNPNDQFKETGSTQRQSSFFLGATAASCTSLLGVFCTEAVGSGPWSDGDICNVLRCNDIDLLCPPDVASVRSGEKYNFYSAVCDNELLRTALDPPFELVCVEGSFSTDMIGQNVTVNQQRTCSFSTSSIGHGTFTLQCLSGTCEEDSSGSSLVISDLPSDCLLDVSFQTCKRLRLSFLLAIPTVLSAAVVLCCTCLIGKRTKVNAQEYVTSVDKGFASKSLETDKNDDAPKKMQKPYESYLYLVFKEVEFSLERETKSSVFSFSGSTPKSKKILRRVSGYFGGPEMLCILGASGSGKTTLIDILAGRKTLGTINSGGITLGNEYATPRSLRNKCGYVMQDSVLPGTQTVFEYLMFHAYLRTKPGPGYSVVELRKDKVEQVIKSMGLTKCLHTLIGDSYVKGISGGEQRRTSIAVELLAGKRLILLDEPTSGLDSSASIQVMSSLRRVCNSGTGVAASIHQPSSRLFYMFDRVMVLTRHGYTAYMGPASEMISFFESLGHTIPKSQYNPAEFALEVATMDDTNKLNGVVASYFDSKFFQNEVETLRKVVTIDFESSEKEDDDYQSALVHSSTPSFYRQFFALGIRFATNVVRHPVLPMVHVFSTILICTMAALLYLNITDDLGGAINRAGFFFFIMVYLTLSALADLGVWFEERLIYTREQSSGCYNGVSYLLAKLLCEILPLRLAPIAAGTFILVFGIGLQDGPEQVTAMYFALVFISLISVMAFLLIGMLIRSSGTANFVAVIVALVSILMSGFLLIDFGSFSAGESSDSANQGTDNFLPTLLGYMSYLRPAFEILMVNELSGLIFQVTLVTENGAAATDTSIPASGDLVLAQLNLQPDDLSKNFVFLGLWFVFFFSLAAMVLSILVKERR